VSARSGVGLDVLAGLVSQSLSFNFLDLDVETTVDNGRLLALLAAHGEVLSQRYDETRVVVHCRVPQRAMGYLYDAKAVFRPHAKSGNGNGHTESSLEQLLHGNGHTSGN